MIISFRLDIIQKTVQHIIIRIIVQKSYVQYETYIENKYINERYSKLGGWILIRWDKKLIKN